MGGFVIEHITISSIIYALVLNNLKWSATVKNFPNQSSLLKLYVFTECTAGTWGANCSNACGDNCFRSGGIRGCDHITGICDSCESGYGGENCTGNIREWS